MRALILLLSLIQTSQLSAQTATNSMNTRLGAGANTWIQHGLLATVHPLDLAIQGNGFFVLQNSQGELFLTRHGKFELNADGFITYRDNDTDNNKDKDKDKDRETNESGDLRLLSHESRPINLPELAEEAVGTRGFKSYRIELDGKIKFICDDGTIQTSPTKIGLGTTGPVKSFKRKEHLLSTGHDKIHIQTPQINSAGSIYQYTLEELDAHAYMLFENNYESTSFAEQKTLTVEAEAIITINTSNAAKTGKADVQKIYSKRLRYINGGNYWWQLSGDDRLIWNGKITSDGNTATISSIVIPAWSAQNTSCGTFEPVVTLKINDEAKIESSGENCRLALKIKISK